MGVATQKLCIRFFLVGLFAYSFPLFAVNRGPSPLCDKILTWFGESIPLPAFPVDVSADARRYWLSLQPAEIQKPLKLLADELHRIPHEVFVDRLMQAFLKFYSEKNDGKPLLFLVPDRKWEKEDCKDSSEQICSNHWATSLVFWNFLRSNPTAQVVSVGPHMPSSTIKLLRSRRHRLVYVDDIAVSSNQIFGTFGHPQVKAEIGRIDLVIPYTTRFARRRIKKLGFPLHTIDDVPETPAIVRKILSENPELSPLQKALYTFVLEFTENDGPSILTVFDHSIPDNLNLWMAWGLVTRISKGKFVWPLVDDMPRCRFIPDFSRPYSRLIAYD